jgi:2-dehydro-3-deoxyphosphogluconate aldolase/(4S)-4-hydroxy-2-oxoglutarate aldolase
MPTGGIGPDNLADYFALPAVRAVGGSWMVPRDALGDTERIAGLVRQAVRLATGLRP